MLSRTLATAAAAMAALAAAGCSPPGEGPGPAELPFNVARCVDGLTVAPGEVVDIPAGACVRSPGRRYALAMRLGGALELLPVTATGGAGKPVWTSGSHAAAPGSAAGAFQFDGNLVIYDRPDRTAIWNSASSTSPATYALTATDQGEVLIRDAAGSTLWSSKTGLATPIAAPKPPAG